MNVSRLSHEGAIVVLVALAMSWSNAAATPIMQPAATDTIGIADSLVVVESTRMPAWHSMFTNIPGDWMRYARSTFQSRMIPSMAGMAALTAALIVADDATWKASDRWYKSSTATQEVSDFFEYMGDGRPQFGLAAGFAAYGLVLNDARAVRTGSQVVEAMLACGIVVQVIKHITGRQSPFVSTSPRGLWIPFPNQIEYHKHVPKFDAYPSGHIATALATVTVVVENYPEWKWARPVGYTIVGLIGVAMANTGIHWYSDYPLGLALGYSFGMLASHPGEPESASQEGESTVSVAPVLTPYATGVSLSINF
jgi:hypothetical protein